MTRRIMVVEDNPLNVKLVRTLLALEGYEVVEVRTGELALTKAMDTNSFGATIARYMAGP